MQTRAAGFTVASSTTENASPAFESHAITDIQKKNPALGAAVMNLDTMVPNGKVDWTEYIALEPGEQTAYVEVTNAIREERRPVSKSETFWVHRDNEEAFRGALPEILGRYPDVEARLTRREYSMSTSPFYNYTYRLSGPGDQVEALKHDLVIAG